MATIQYSWSASAISVHFLGFLFFVARRRSLLRVWRGGERTGATKWMNQWMDEECRPVHLLRIICIMGSQPRGLSLVCYAHCSRVGSRGVSRRLLGPPRAHLCLPPRHRLFLSLSLFLSVCLSVCLPVRLSMFSFLISSVHPHKFPALAHKEPAEFPTILVCLIELLNERGVDRNDSCFLISLSSVLAYAPTDIDTNPWLGCKSTDTFQSNSLDHCGARAKTNIRFICYQSRYEFIENHQFIYSNHLDQIQASVVSN